MAEIINLEDERKHQEALKEVVERLTGDKAQKIAAQRHFAADMVRLSHYALIYLASNSQNDFEELVGSMVEKDICRVLTDDKLK